MEGGGGQGESAGYERRQVVILASRERRTSSTTSTVRSTLTSRLSLSPSPPLTSSSALSKRSTPPSVRPSSSISQRQSFLPSRRHPLPRLSAPIASPRSLAGRSDVGGPGKRFREGGVESCGTEFDLEVKGGDEGGDAGGDGTRDMTLRLSQT